MFGVKNLNVHAHSPNRSPYSSPQPRLPSVQEERQKKDGTLEAGIPDPEASARRADGSVGSETRAGSRSFWSWGRKSPSPSLESTPTRGTGSPTMATSPSPSSSFSDWFFGEGGAASPSGRKGDTSIDRTASGLDLYEVERQVSCEHASFPPDHVVQVCMQGDMEQTSSFEGGR